MRRTLITFAVASAFVAAPVCAKEPELDKAKVKAAIDKGLAWIKTRQKPDGSFDEGYS